MIAPVNRAINPNPADVEEAQGVLGGLRLPHRHDGNNVPRNRVPIHHLTLLKVREVRPLHDELAIQVRSTDRFG